MSDAFDSDVLIYSAQADPRGAQVRDLIAESSAPLGSVVLVPEVLGRPLRLGQSEELESLIGLLSRLDLKDVDAEVADVAASFSAAYNLRAADAIHLATAVIHGASRFHTNNRKDFGAHIVEVEVVHPPLA